MTIDSGNEQTTQFSHIDISEFFDSPGTEQDDESTRIVVLTPHERELVSMVFNRLKIISPETLAGLVSRIPDLERLAGAIARFPSLLQKQVVSREVRTQQTLIKSLLTYRDGDRMLYLPSKAILGKGFLVAKFHAFSSMAQISRESGFSVSEINKLRKATLTLLFTIMAEDVYLTLLEDTTIPTAIRQEIASSLIILWEHRSDRNVADMAPVLEAVWTVRDKLAPAFGTMVGTSELLLLSIELDEQWRQFISAKLGDSDVSKAMEEFLFGLSYEQICQVKMKLKELGISAIGRDEINSFLGKDTYIKTGFDPRSFYQLYTIRRDNARVRQRMDLEGPHKTLEDHFMKFILEKNREKQRNDVNTT